MLKEERRLKEEKLGFYVIGEEIRGEARRSLSFVTLWSIRWCIVRLQL